MATVVYTGPTTYLPTEGGDLLYAVPLSGYVDEPGATITIRLGADAGSPVLATATASSTPVASGPHAGWYAWAFSLESLALPGATILVPAAAAVAGAVAPGFAGAVAIPAAAAVGSAAAPSFEEQPANTVPIPSAAAVGGAAAPEFTGVVLVPAAGATGGAVAIGIEAQAGGGAFSDDFNRANSTGLGANWATIAGDAAFNVNANQAVAGGANSGSRVIGTFAADQYAEVDVAQIVLESSGLQGGGGPAVRASDSARTRYVAACASWDDGEGGIGEYIKIFKIVAGVYTRLGAAWDAPLGTFPQRVRIEAQGTTIRAYTVVGGVKTLRIEVTDSSIASGTIALHSREGVARFDNFAGGDL
jgi:hypothetical protein